MAHKRKRTRTIWTPEKREEQAREEIELYLMSFKIAHDRPSMTAEELGAKKAAGVRSYFEEHPEDWEPLAAWARKPEEDRGLFDIDDLERLLVPDLVLRVHAYMREELGYKWLTTERVFAYDYSF